MNDKKYNYNDEFSNDCSLVIFKNNNIYINPEQKKSYHVYDNGIIAGLGTGKLKIEKDKDSLYYASKFIAESILFRENLIEDEIKEKKPIETWRLKNSNNWIYEHKCMLAKEGTYEKEIVEKLVDGIYYSVANEYLIQYEYSNISEEKINKTDRQKKSSYIVICINDTKIFISTKNIRLIKDIVLEEIRNNKNINIYDKPKSFYFKNKDFCLYRKIKSVYISNNQIDTDYENSDYKIINIIDKSEDEILKSITDIGEYFQDYYITKNLTLADKNNQEILLINEGESCLISIIDGHWYINNENVVSYRNSNVDNPMIRENVELNKERIIKGFNNEPKDIQKGTLTRILYSKRENLYKNLHLSNMISKWIIVKRNYEQ